MVLMTNRRKKTPVFVVVLLIIVVVLSLVFMTFLSGKTALRFYCDEGEFAGFGKTSMPMMCAACIPVCHATAKVLTSNNETICDNVGGDDGTGGNIAVVPCPGLNKYEGEELKIIYSISSTEKNSNGEIKIIYGE